MYVDFMINDSLQPDAMQIVLLRTLKLSASINISAPKHIKYSLLIFSFQEVKKKAGKSFITTAVFEFELCE